MATRLASSGSCTRTIGVAVVVALAVAVEQQQLQWGTNVAINGVLWEAAITARHLR